MPKLALRSCFLFLVLIYSLFLFSPISLLEPALPDYDNTELIHQEQDLMYLLKETEIHKLRYGTYQFLINAGTSLMSKHLGGHAPPFAFSTNAV